MKLSAFEEAKRTRTTQIAVLQDELKVIQTAEDLIRGAPVAVVPRGTKPRRKSKVESRARRRRVAWSFLATIPGAIKYLLRDEPAGASFTRELLTQNLREDADFKRLYEANVEGAEKSIENALRNWTFSGRLKKDGANYTITNDGTEWFK